MGASDATISDSIPIPPSPEKFAVTSTPTPTPTLPADQPTNTLHNLLTSHKVGDMVAASSLAHSYSLNTPSALTRNSPSKKPVNPSLQTVSRRHPSTHRKPVDSLACWTTRTLSRMFLKCFIKSLKTSPPLTWTWRQVIGIPLVAVYSDAPLIDAVEEFVRARVHRIVVLERPLPDAVEPSKFLGVLSQSSVVGLLAKKFGRLGQEKREGAEWELGNKSLQELGLVRGDVVSVSSYDTVLEALFIMHANSVSSVAILDRASGSPQILSTRGGWRRLYEPCFRFFCLEAGGSDRVPSFSVHPSTPLVVAIEKMAATHTHRVWIVDQEETGGLCGVLSLSDVMTVLLPSAGAV
ncbi:hypothetical protein BC829DRAFT_401654 [Chytridium lagenaria]|nr:hypothetical protein BC829DRAFT_401654 [Chytridium lagenaria]